MFKNIINAKHQNGKPLTPPQKTCLILGQLSRSVLKINMFHIAQTSALTHLQEREGQIDFSFALHEHLTF